MPRGGTTQTRSFDYGTPPGALLLSANNPETGTVTYSYTNGLMTAKVDANGQRTEYSYDSYNRPTQIRHLPNGVTEDLCQRVDLTYDSNGIGGFNYLAGRLATRAFATCPSPDGTNPVRTDFTDMFSYKQAGQVELKRLRVSRTVSNQANQPVTVYRDLDASWAYTGTEGQMTSVTYPVGTGGPSAGTYNYGYDDQGRPYSMNDGSSSLISSVGYGVANELLSITGTFYNETRSYNARLQLTSLNGTTFTYPAGTNNGRILTQTDVSGETITYQYDQLNRLVSAVGSGTWGQTYSYDGYGNLTAKNSAPGKLAVTFGASFTNNKQTDLSYDAKGNQLNFIAGQSQVMFYDVENRLTRVQRDYSSPMNGYGYDPDNRRVYKAVWTWNGSSWNAPAEEISYFAGQKLSSYTLTAMGGANPSMTLTAVSHNVYFGSRLIRKVNSDGTYTAMQADRLGSFGKYAPYGEQRDAYGTGDNTEKFATYYRDAGTGLDYAVNRYYNSASGRFTTADPYRASAGAEDPGSWNRFAYTRGDPANRHDPFGLADYSVTGYCYGCAGGFNGAGGSAAGSPGTGQDMETVNAWDAYDGGSTAVASSDNLQSRVSSYSAEQCTASLLITLECDSSTEVYIAAAASRWWVGIAGTWWAAAKLMGQLAEAKVSALIKVAEKNTQYIRNTLSGTDRIPDFWNGNTIYEVKNVSYLSMTAQIRDFAYWAASGTGRTFELWVRRGAELSSELSQAINEDLITLKWFDWP